MALPVISPEARAEALQKAAVARKARAAALAGIRNGTVAVADVLADSESPLRRAKVEQVLRAIPGMGKVSVAKLMEEVGIDPSRRIAGLGSRQRTALTEFLAA